MNNYEIYLFMYLCVDMKGVSFVENKYLSRVLIYIILNFLL